MDYFNSLKVQILRMKEADYLKLEAIAIAQGIIPKGIGYQRRVNVFHGLIYDNWYELNPYEIMKLKDTQWDESHLKRFGW